MRHCGARDWCTRLRCVHARAASISSLCQAPRLGWWCVRGCCVPCLSISGMKDKERGHARHHPWEAGAHLPAEKICCGDVSTNPLYGSCNSQSVTPRSPLWQTSKIPPPHEPNRGCPPTPLFKRNPPYHHYAISFCKYKTLDAPTGCGKPPAYENLYLGYGNNHPDPRRGGRGIPRIHHHLGNRP